LKFGLLAFSASLKPYRYKGKILAAQSLSFKIAQLQILSVIKNLFIPLKISARFFVVDKIYS